MIRMVGTRIIIPKGDTGFFYLMNKGAHSENDVAVFSVKDSLTKKTVIEKIVEVSECSIKIKIESKEQAQSVPSPCTSYALFKDGEFLTNEQQNDKKFLKLVQG